MLEKIIDNMKLETSLLISKNSYTNGNKTIDNNTTFTTVFDKNLND